MGAARELRVGDCLRGFDFGMTGFSSLLRASTSRCTWQRRSDDAPSEDERRYGDNEKDEEEDPRQTREIASQAAETKNGSDDCNQEKRNGPVEHGSALPFEWRRRWPPGKRAFAFSRRLIETPEE
jgi:hypothetical protein